ncbi:MAG: hypothetical protein K2F94_05045 [Muribaculaceae bacterium]|nr:hypothetical protein [Muribaculaceae bacterium]
MSGNKVIATNGSGDYFIAPARQFGTLREFGRISYAVRILSTGAPTGYA